MVTHDGPMDFYGDDIYRFREDGAEAELTRFNTKGDSISCELRVRWRREPHAGLIHGPARTNLLADRTLKTVANHCAEQVPGEWKGVEWWRFLSDVREKAVTRFREGDPLVPLVETEPDTRRWLLSPMLEYGGPTVIAAPGGAYKSLIALAVAARVAGFPGAGWFPQAPRDTVPVAYLDWEADQATFRNRLDALCHTGTIPPNLFYRRERLPLTETADDLARLLSKHDIGMVVVDSKGVAAGGAVLEADGVLRLFAAIRRLGVPCLVVDHVTKRARFGKEHSSPFGSVYTENVARQVWTAAAPAELGDGHRVVWQLTKSNNGRVGQRLAWQIKIVTDNGLWTRVELESVDPSEAVVLDGVERVEDEIAGVLSVYGPLHYSGIAEHLPDRTAGTIKSTLNRHKERFVAVPSQRGVWMLLPSEEPNTIPF